jgi:WD40-like Beta Propeller Repeat
MRFSTTCCLLLAISVTSFSQVKQRKLGPALNNPSFNYWAPYVSLDGNTLLLTCDYTEDSKPATFIALRQGVDWKDPVLIPKKMTALGFTKAFTVDVDGKTLYITSSRGGSLGGFDIFVSKITGTTFTDPQPIGAPINSAAHEASPTFSPDGTTLYFMRCGKMDFNGASDCKIVMAKKKYGVWEKPIELPAIINAGNSQMPRMLGDGITLLFSSDKHKPGKGGMDLYISRLNDGQWEMPINLDFVNTAKDDIYASASAQGLNLLKDAMGPKKSELVEFQFPPEVKPKAVIRIVGIVEGITELAKANVSVVNLDSKKTQFYLNPDAKGNFVCYIPEGALYGLFVDAPTDNFRFFSKRYDLTPGKKFGNIDRITASLKIPKAGDEMELTAVSFKPFSSEIEPTSIVDLQKLSRLMKGNPTLKFNVDVSLFGLEKDSVQREGLTEILPDTVVYTMEVQLDSVTTESRDSIAVENIYHNDRTVKQANALKEYFVGQGIQQERISITQKALPEPVAEKRRTVVYLRAR